MDSICCIGKFINWNVSMCITHTMNCRVIRTELNITIYFTVFCQCNIVSIYFRTVPVRVPITFTTITQFTYTATTKTTILWNIRFELNCVHHRIGAVLAKKCVRCACCGENRFRIQHLLPNKSISQMQIINNDWEIKEKNEDEIVNGKLFYCSSTNKYILIR